MPVVPAAGYPTGPEAPPAVPLSPPEDYQRIQPTPDAFGAQVGQSMSALGRVLTTSADEFAQVARERQDLHNNVVSDNQINNFNDKANNLLYGDPSAPPGSPEAIGYYGLRGQAAIDAYPKMRDALQTSREQMRGQLENPMQQLNFDKETRHQLSLEMARVGSHYDQQYDVFQTKTNEAGVEVARRKMDQAALAGDDAAFTEQVGSAMDWGMKDLQARGLDKNPEEVWAMQGRVRADAVERRLNGYRANGNTEGILHTLSQESGPDGAISAEKAAEYRKIVDSIEADKAARRHLQPGGVGGGGQFSAPPGEPIAGATPDEQQMLNEIRQRESTTNYTSIGPVAKGQGHFGAYQFDPPTWQEAAAGTGLGKEYATADKAPKEIQDANALWLLRHRGTQPWAASGPYPALGGAGGRPAAAAGGVGVPPGTIDKTAEAGFGTRFGPLESPQGMIIHHTAGGGSVDEVISTFKQTGYPAQFVIDRDGKIYQTLPDGYRGQHIRDSWGPLGAGKTNANMEGVEIIANNDGDVLPVQQEAAARLVAARAAKWGYDPRTSVFGHGEVNPGHKEADEGMSTVTRIRNGSLSVAPPQQVASARPQTAPEGAIIQSPGKPPLQNVGGKWVPYLPAGV